MSDKNLFFETRALAFLILLHRQKELCRRAGTLKKREEAELDRISGVLWTTGKVLVRDALKLLEEGPG